MAIWVSRYSNKELKSGKYYPVGISIGKPRWPLGYEVKEQCFSLAPKGYMLRMDDKQEYRQAYVQKLEGIGADKIISIVGKMDKAAMAEGKELVLLCYEDVRNEEDWCHRTMFADWWMEKTGEIIEELYDPSEPKKKKEPQKKEETPKAEEPETKQMTIFDLLQAAT